MPKKTKREKIRAEERRKNFPTQTIQQSEAPEYFTFEFAQPQNNTPDPHRRKGETEEFIAIKHDLTKTVLLAAIAISIEFVLFWTRRYVYP